MKHLSLVLILAVFALAACSGGGDSAQTEQAAADTQAVGEHADAEAAPASNLAQAKMPDDGETVSLEGTLGCGHCTYHVGESCSAALRTADGGIYILDVAQDSEWFQDRFSGKQLKVEGVVHIKDDLHHITASSIQPL